MERAVASLIDAPRDRRPNFCALLGHEAWTALPSAIRCRFAHEAMPRAAVSVYVGHMHVHASWMGRIAAHLCTLIGTPVAPYVGRDVPVRVRVFDREDGSGTVWERIYDFVERRVTVISTKQIDAQGRLVEALSAGLRMRLQVLERDGALHFVSTGYYFDWFGCHIPLPIYLTPGHTHVVHEELGDGLFRFSMTTTHPWWGEVYYQVGDFALEKADD